jgi:hypothetical protein
VDQLIGSSFFQPIFCQRLTGDRRQLTIFNRLFWCNSISLQDDSITSSRAPSSELKPAAGVVSSEREYAPLMTSEEDLEAPPLHPNVSAQQDGQQHAQ